MKRIRWTLAIISYSVILLMGCASTQTVELKQEIADLKQQMVAMADDLKKISGNEGYNFDTLYTVSQGYSTNLKYLRNKLTELMVMSDLTRRILERTDEKSLVTIWYEREPLKLRIRVINPSDVDTIEVPVKVYLPKEIKPEDILEKDDTLNVAYAEDKGIYYVYTPEQPEKKHPILSPKQYAEFTVFLTDVWIIPEERSTSILSEAKGYLSQLKSTPHQEKAQFFFNYIDIGLGEVMEAQRRGKKGTVEKHIAIYRENLESLKKANLYLGKLKELRQDFILERLEKSLEELKKRLK